ncbi:MAG: hypothetical protein ACE5DQ_01110, partial [Candidatus Paceibacterota bacterium]
AFYVIITLGLNPKSARKTGKGPIRQLTPIPKVSMILFVILLASNIYFSYMYLSNARWHREDWRSAVTYTDQFLGKGGIALTEHSAPWAPMNWYSRKPQRYIGASATMQITDESIARKLDTLLVDIKPRGSDKNQPGVKRVILYTYLFEISDPYSRVEQYLLKNGYKISEEKDFHGVGIVKVFTR